VVRIHSVRRLRALLLLEATVRLGPFPGNLAPEKANRTVRFHCEGGGYRGDAVALMFVVIAVVLVVAAASVAVTRFERERHRPASRIEHARRWRRSSGPG